MNNGGAAFPRHFDQSSGMTLRDYFAAKAMQAMISNEALCQRFISACKDPSEESHLVAEAAYMAADAMLKAREVAE